MRKLFIAFTIAMLIIPAIAFAQGGKVEALRAALNAKLSPSIEVPKAKSAEPQVVAVAIDYQWAAMFPYQASNDRWWSGLVITNGVNPNDIMVLLNDSAGSLVGKGTFHIVAFNEQRVAMLQDMIGVGYVPERGSVYVYGTNSFSTLIVVANSDGAFGVLEQEVINF